MTGKGTSLIPTGFIICGMGLAFMALGAFIPEDGLIYKGLFSPLIMPMLMGFICFLGGVGIFVKYFDMKSKAKKHNWIGEKLIIQEEPQIVFFFVGAMTLIVALPAFGLGLLYPETGFIYMGIYSELIMALIIGFLFMVVGIVFLCYGIEAILLKRIYKRLKNGGSSFIAAAKCCFEEFEKENVLGEKQGFGRIDISNKVVYKYVDESGIERLTLSLQNYSKKQIEWYKNKGGLSVSCFGKRSVLIDQPPKEEEVEE